MRFAGVLALTVLVFSMQPARACRAIVELRDAAGAPAIAGLVVRIGVDDAVVERAWSGSGPLVIDDVPCGTARLEAVFHVRSWDGSDVVQVLASTSADTRGSSPFALTVPVLVPLTVRARDDAGDPAIGVSFGALAVDWPDGASRPRGCAGQTGGRDAVFFLEPGTFRLKYLTGSQRLLATTLNGAPAQDPLLIDLRSGPATVEYTVAKSIPIEGSVHDPEGRGQGGVFVVVLGTDAQPLEYAATRDDGSFRIASEALPATIAIHDEADRFVFEPQSVTLDTREAAGRVSIVARPLDRARLRLHVTDGEHAPVPDVAIDLVWGVPGTSGQHQTTVRSDASGTALVPCEPGSSIRLHPQSDARGYVGDEREIKVDACSEDQVLVLLRGVIFKGRVRDAAGQPLAKLALQLHRDENGAQYLVTDADGRFTSTTWRTGHFTFANDVARNQGTAQRLIVVRSGRERSKDRPGAVEALKPGTIEVELRAVPGSMICATTKERDDKPVPLSKLRVFRAGDDEPVAAQARDTRSGRAELCAGPLLPGDYQVLVGELTGGFIPLWWPGNEERATAGTVVVKAGQDVPLSPLVVTPAGSLNLRMPANAAVRGTEFVVEFQQGDAWITHPASRVIVNAHQTPVHVIAHGVVPGTSNVRVCEAPAPRGCGELPHWSVDAPVSVAAGRWTDAALK